MKLDDIKARVQQCGQKCSTFLYKKYKNYLQVVCMLPHINTEYRNQAGSFSYQWVLEQNIRVIKQHNYTTRKIQQPMCIRKREEGTILVGAPRHKNPWSLGARRSRTPIIKGTVFSNFCGIYFYKKNQNSTTCCHKGIK